jgi:hypothetical protein
MFNACPLVCAIGSMHKMYSNCSDYLSVPGACLEAFRKQAWKFLEFAGRRHCITSLLTSAARLIHSSAFDSSIHHVQGGLFVTQSASGDAKSRPPLCWHFPRVFTVISQLHPGATYAKCPPLRQCHKATDGMGHQLRLFWRCSHDYDRFGPSRVQTITARGMEKVLHHSRTWIALYLPPMPILQ